MSLILCTNLLILVIFSTRKPGTGETPRFTPTHKYNAWADDRRKLGTTPGSVRRGKYIQQKLGVGLKLSMILKPCRVSLLEKIKFCKLVVPLRKSSLFMTVDWSMLHYCTSLVHVSMVFLPKSSQEFLRILKDTFSSLKYH